MTQRFPRASSTTLQSTIFAIALLISGASSAKASTIVILSGDGNESCRVAPFSSSNNGNCTATVIVPAPHWANPPDGAKWISFGDTGYGGGIAVPAPSVPLATVMQIAETFATSGNETLVMDLWAGSTATVAIMTDFHGFSSSGHGFTFIPPDDSANNTNCELAVPGCVQPLRGAFYFDAPGSYGLFFSVFQTADRTPFGVRYSGEFVQGNVSATAVPEPSSLVLFSIGAAGLIRTRRSRRVLDLHFAHANHGSTAAARYVALRRESIKPGADRV